MRILSIPILQYSKYNQVGYPHF